MPSAHKKAEDQKIFRETNFTPFLWIAPRRRFLSQRHHLVIEIIPLDENDSYLHLFVNVSAEI